MSVYFDAFFLNNGPWPLFNGQKEYLPPTPRVPAGDGFIDPPQSYRGSALIGLVVAILIFSILAAAIVPMLSSSGQQTAAGAMGTKAYLLAESGFRFAASKYLHAGDSDRLKNQAIEDLDGNYTLSDGNSRFRLDVFSYYYELVGAAPGAVPNEFKAHCPGSFPDDVSLANGLELSIGDEIYTIAGTAAIAGEQDDNVTIAVDRQLSVYQDRTLVYPVADVDSSRTASVSNGGNLAYMPADARLFPLRNGHIRVNGRYLSYRFNDRNHDQFADVSDPDDDTMENFPIPAGSKIILSKYVRVKSTGIHGSGALQARRQIIYNTPLTLSSAATQNVQFSDPFKTKDNWTDTQGTVTVVGDAAGNSALKVEGTAVSGADKGALTVFSPTTPEAQAIDFNASRRGTKGYLSYDTQIKIGFENLPIPVMGFFPESPVPASFAAGLSFRLSNTDAGLFSSNGYGLSILRGNNSIDAAIPDEILPLSDQRAIVLWQQTGNGSQRTWLAYKAVPINFPLPLEDFNGSDGSWAPSSGMWQYAPVSPPGNGTPAWHCDYNFAGFNSATLESPLSYDLPPDYPQTTLTLRSWLQAEANDIAEVRVLAGAGALKTLTLNGQGSPGWNNEALSLSEFAGQSIAIQFYFERVGGLNAGLQGWYIDDVQIRSEWPVQNATLGVRLQEAMVVRFYDGYPEIKSGSRLYGHNRNTTATVLVPPLLVQGNWGAASPAIGVLLLSRPSVLDTAAAFDADEVLTAIGGSGGRALVQRYDEARDRKANIIQVFYASESGGGNGLGNTNPLDIHTRPYPRRGDGDGPAWPPVVDGDGNWTDEDGNWTAAEDFFRYIQWDDINTGNVSGLEGISYTTKDQGLVQNTIIQSHQADLQSPPYPGRLSEFEIGLHALGDGALNLYFDDFGIQLDVAQTNTIPNPLQE